MDEFLSPQESQIEALSPSLHHQDLTVIALMSLWEPLQCLSLGRTHAFRLREGYVQFQMDQWKKRDSDSFLVLKA